MDPPLSRLHGRCRDRRAVVDLQRTQFDEGVVRQPDLADRRAGGDIEHDGVGLAPHKLESPGGVGLEDDGVAFGRRSSLQFTTGFAVERDGAPRSQRDDHVGRQETHAHPARIRGEAQAYAGGHPHHGVHDRGHLQARPRRQAARRQAGPTLVEIERAGNVDGVRDQFCNGDSSHAASVPMPADILACGRRRRLSTEAPLFLAQACTIPP